MGQPGNNWIPHLENCHICGGSPSIMEWMGNTWRIGCMRSCDNEPIPYKSGRGKMKRKRKAVEEWNKRYTEMLTMQDGDKL